MRNPNPRRPFIAALAVLMLLAALLPVTALADQDTTPPWLRGIGMYTAGAKVPADLPIFLDVADDLSGADWGHIVFRCEETGETVSVTVSATYRDENTGETVPQPDGKLHGLMHLPEKLKSGGFFPYSLQLTDRAGNTRLYNRTGEAPGEQMPQWLADYRFYATAGDVVDTTPPEVTGMTLSTTRVSPSGQVEFAVDATDDVAGVSLLNAYFYCPENGARLHSLAYRTYFDLETQQEKEYPDGKFHGMLYIPADMEACTFHLSGIVVWDKAGNFKEYADNYNDAMVLIPEGMRDIRLEVVDEPAQSTANGWVQENGNWYFYENGTLVRNQWRQDSLGWCYLGSDGAMVTNTWVADSVGWCYISDNGYWVTDTWVLYEGDWYYLNEYGYMVTDQWRKDSHGWCYLGADGAMLTDCWLQDSKGWCYIGVSGYCETNCWKLDSCGWLYLDSEGSMTKSAWVEDGGSWYYLDANGYMVTGTHTIGGTVYTFNSSGIWIA